MDEPPATLGFAEAAKVEDIIGGLKARMMSILLVNDNLDQVFRLSDRICVLKRGRQEPDRFDDHGAELSRTSRN